MSEPPEVPPVVAPLPYPQQSPFMQFASHSSTDSMATLNSKTSLPEAPATAVSLQVCSMHIADRLALFLMCCFRFKVQKCGISRVSERS